MWAAWVGQILSSCTVTEITVMYGKDNHSGRAGVYKKQPDGFRAFIPAALPPHPPVEMKGELQRRLSKADLALGRLDGSIQTLPNPEIFVLMYVRKEAVLSSQIEGTQSSLHDLLEAEAKILRGPRSDVGEIVNYVTAMRHGLERLPQLPVSVRLIREIHARLLDGVRGAQLLPGELRKTQNWIGPAGCLPQEAVFVPPPPMQIADDLSSLEKFIHQPLDLPLLVKIGLVHAQFETIHPFLDGNGRVGRLLITLLLCEQRVLTAPVLYLSSYLKRHKQEYYDCLQATRDKGAWERWLAFFLRGVAEVSAEAAKTAREILLLREEHRTRINERFGRTAANGHRVLDRLFERPIVSVRDVMAITGTDFAAANNLVGRMSDSGIVQEITGRSRNRMYMHRDYVGLFHEAESAFED